MDSRHWLFAWVSYSHVLSGLDVHVCCSNTKASICGFVATHWNLCRVPFLNAFQCSWPRSYVVENCCLHQI